MLVLWRKGEFGTPYVSLAGWTSTSYKYSHVCLNVHCTGFLVLLWLHIFFACCACYISSTPPYEKCLCGNSEETLLYHYIVVAVDGYCQPLGYYNRWKNQNSNCATGWTTRGSILGTVNKFFSPLDHPDQLFSSLNRLLKRYRGFFPWVEVARVKNECSYTTTPPIITSWCRHGQLYLLPSYLYITLKPPYRNQNMSL